MNQIFKFHVPWRVPVSLAFILMWVPMLFMYYDLGTYVFMIVILNLSVGLVGVWYISVVTISSNGITIYRINKLKWDDIVEAKRIRFFGIPHIRIKRKRGLPLSFGPKTGRFEIIRNAEWLDESRSETCVMYKSASKDFGVEAKRGGEFSVLETTGMHCVHPVKSEVGVQVEFSRKAPPTMAYPDFEAEGKAVLASVVFHEF